MSWLNLNQSLSTIKGQITNFASEVLSEGNAEDSDDQICEIAEDLTYLQNKCVAQELEIQALKKLTDELQTTIQAEKLSRKNGVKDEDMSWYWDPPPQTSGTTKMEADLENNYKQQIQALQDEISNLNGKHSKSSEAEELNRLREENQNLTSNLEDLDNQHQMAMERLLTLKKELQKNFEVLREEHDELKKTNYNFSEEINSLKAEIKEKNESLELMAATKADYDTLHHKYQNLERVHSLLRENAEKFQEENQELHEEIFQLQEQVTKLGHELELSSKHSELSDAVPRERYEELLKELNDLRECRRSSSRLQLEETNIDDNAKSVIEKLKREISDLRLKLEQKDTERKADSSDSSIVKVEKIMQLYSKHVNFEIPVDLVGEIPSSGDNMIMYKLESVFKTLNYLKKEIDTLEHKLSEKTLNQNHLQTQIDDLTTENDFLAADIQQYEREISEIKKNNDFLLSELTGLKNTSKLEPIIETHEDNIAKLETELADSNRINKSFESEIKRIEEELAEVKVEKVALQENLADLKDKYNAMLSELEIYKTQSKELEELQSTENLEQTEKIKCAQDEIVDLKSKLNTANSKNEQSNIDIRILENDKVILTKKIDDLIHDGEEKDSAVRAAVAMNSRLESTIQELETNLKQAQKKHVEVQRTDIELINRLRDVLRTDDSSSATRELEDETDRIVQDVEKKMSVIRILQNQLDKSKMDNIQLTRSLEEATRSSIALTDRASSLQTQVDNLEDTGRHLLHGISMIDDSRNPESYARSLDELSRRLRTQNSHNEQMQLELEREGQYVPPMNNLHTDDINLFDLPNLPRMARLDFPELERMDRILNSGREIERMDSEIKLRDSEIQELNLVIMQCNSNLEHLNQIISGLQETVDIKNNEIENLQQSLSQMIVNSEETYQELQQSKILINKYAEEKSTHEGNVLVLQGEVNMKGNVILELKSIKEDLELRVIEYKTELEIRNNKIKEMKNSIYELKDKLQSRVATSKESDTETIKIINEKEELQKDNDELKRLLTEKEQQLSEQTTTIEKLQKSNSECKTFIDNSNMEKNELINLINLKHNESIQYHNEIQRLNQVILEQNNEFKKILEEKDRLLQTQSVLDNKCSDCEKLKSSLKAKDEIIGTLTQNLADYEKIQNDLHNANGLIVNLTERCENLDKNLTIQLDTVKHLTAKNAQLLEQEENSSKELERLRRHLLEMEESHTQELMMSEQRLNECQSRLQQVEERAKQTSTVYTSNSIRANQEVETLRNQIRLLEKQREEVQARLSEEENSRLRNEAALTNLQIVLEQFQQDKERDIHAATEKIRNNMADLTRHNGELNAEISRLNAKLEESLAGLQAATRLGEQLESKTASINDLKEQVRTLQTSLRASEERYYNAISNQQDKVDKNLVKNLVLNYVQKTNNPTNRTQVLRILSTVLDFNQKECETLGLVRGTSSGDSLAQEFVRFLEKESRPAAPLPSMMGLTQSNGSSRSGTPPAKNNTLLGAYQAEAGHKRNTSTGSNNLLFQNIEATETSSQVSLETSSVHSDRANEARLISIASPVLENSGVNQMRNTEGAILKHVLKDM